MKWFFLRGLIRESRHWHQFPRKFKTFFPEAEIDFLEIPGTGKYYHQPSPLSIAEMVDFLERTHFANYQGSKPYILSISLGGMITLEWLRRHPERFAGAVLMNTSVSGLNPFYQRLMPHNYLPLLKLFGITTPEGRETALLRLISNEPLHHGVAAQKFGQIQRARPVSRSNALRQIYAASRYRLTEKPQGTPLLLLNAEGDHFVDPGCTRELSQYLGIPYYTHPSAGHDLPLDAPEWILERIAAWLQELQ